eukprot:s3099_g1.t1
MISQLPWRLLDEADFSSYLQHTFQIHDHQLTMYHVYHGQEVMLQHHLYREPPGNRLGHLAMAMIAASVIPVQALTASTGSAHAEPRMRSRWSSPSRSWNFTWIAAAAFGVAVRTGRRRCASENTLAGSTSKVGDMVRSPDVVRYLVTPELSRWKRPFKPRIRPEKDHTRYPDDEPRRSRPYFAKYALMAKELCWVTSYQLEDVFLAAEARREIVAATNRSAKVYLRVYPHNAVSQRRLEGIADSRIGASKGKFEYWVAALKPGVVIFELDVESEELARMALKAGSRKLPIKVGFQMREEGPSLFEISG